MTRPASCKVQTVSEAYKRDVESDINVVEANRAISGTRVARFSNGPQCNIRSWFRQAFSPGWHCLDYTEWFESRNQTPKNPGAMSEYRAEGLYSKTRASGAHCNYVYSRCSHLGPPRGSHRPRSARPLTAGGPTGSRSPSHFCQPSSYNGERDPLAKLQEWSQGEQTTNSATLCRELAPAMSLFYDLKFC